MDQLTPRVRLCICTKFYICTSESISGQKYRIWQFGSNNFDTHLKEFMEGIKQEQKMFGDECKDAQKQGMFLEKTAAENPPPPLISDKSTPTVSRARGDKP